ncbi:MAG: dipicolinate synthase subunit B [Ruminococcaceae bacterium]|nr:dipicolinate synthase subunit B [Oscillospiraceae bacterium]
MKLADRTIGFALTGSFCTFASVLPEIAALSSAGAKVVPIMSETAYSTDTRFGTAAGFRDKIEEITGREIICTVAAAEPIGPKNLLDALIIAPCTGNTLGKLANGITDSSVTMAAKASLRNENPLIIAVSTNDGLGNSARNIGTLLNSRNVYFVPFTQDDPVKKCNSLVARMELIVPAVEAAMEGRQMQPVLYREK